MGRILQRKKARSSIPKSRSAVRRSRKTKKTVIAGSEIIRANWNKDETLAQNYARLGLTSKLGKRAGGTDIVNAATLEGSAPGKLSAAATAAVERAASGVRGKKERLVPGEARVERNEDGSIKRVVHAPRTRMSLPGENDSDADSDLDDDASNNTTSKGEQPKTDVIRALEAQAANPAKKKERWQSERERDWVSRALAKHGDDYAAIVRDPKMNPYQLTLGKIKSMVKRWKAAQEKENIAA